MEDVAWVNPDKQAVASSTCALENTAILAAALRHNPPPKDVTLTARDLRVAIYARYSTREQKASSIERQIRACERYLRRHGLVPVKVFQDIGLSARTSFDRPDLVLLLNDCEAGKYDMIVVEDFDRWSREIYDAAAMAERLEIAGIEFHCASEERRFTKEDVINAAIRAERDRMRRRNLTSNGRMQLAAQGGAPRGKLYGYDKGEGGFLVKNEEQARIIRDIYRMADGGMSIRGISDRLTADNEIGPSGRCYWPVSTVQDILTNPIYCGIVMYGVTESRFDRQLRATVISRRAVDQVATAVNDDYRIIEPATWRRVLNRAGGPTGPKGSYRQHLLSKRAWCDCPGKADHPFTPSRGRMNCTNQIMLGSCAGPTASLSQRDVETGVVRALIAKLRGTVDGKSFEQAFAEAIAEVEAARKAKRQRIKARMERIDVELDRSMQKEIAEAFGDERVLANATKLRTELRELASQLAGLREESEQAQSAPGLAGLAEGLERLVSRLPFAVLSPVDAEFLVALRRVVKRVDVRRQGLPVGRVRLAVHVDFAAYIDEIDDETSDKETEILFVDIEARHAKTRYARMLAETRRLQGEGGYGLTDEQWRSVEEKLPDVTTRFKDTAGMTPRMLVDALMLRLRTGHSIKSCQTLDPIPLTNALGRFVYAGGDRILLDVLGANDPGFVAKLDLRALDAARKRWQRGSEFRQHRLTVAGRLHALDRTTALTDVQWEASAVLIHPTVERSSKGERGVPARQLLEAILLKLRADVPWGMLPRRFGDTIMLFRSVRRLVYSGSWDRLKETWSRRFPELMHELDTAPLDHQPKGSPEWRGLTTDSTVERPSRTITNSAEY